MLCSSCGKNEAAVYYKKLVNNQVAEAHVCLDCADELKSAGLSTGSPIFDILSAVGAAPPRRRAPRCAACGIPYAEFKKSGFLGCVDCYAQFAEPLKQVLKSIHGAVRHRGKIPAWAEGEAKVKRLKELQKELDASVREERYERAAQLRNKMRELEA